MRSLWLMVAVLVFFIPLFAGCAHRHVSLDIVSVVPDYPHGSDKTGWRWGELEPGSTMPVLAVQPPAARLKSEACRVLDRQDALEALFEVLILESGRLAVESCYFVLDDPTMFEGDKFDFWHPVLDHLKQRAKFQPSLLDGQPVRAPVVIRVRARPNPDNSDTVWDWIKAARR